MERYNYVTLFNSAYLNRGLVMYESLKSVSSNFCLYVVCFDNNTYTILKSLNYENLIPVSLEEFEDEKLLSIKPGRTATEYCWTCSASVIWYCIKHYNLKNCAYIDADMYFYSNPEVIWNENKAAEVIITLHNYSNEYDQSAISGKYCVQFVGFKNTSNAMLVLEEWRENCIAWCYNRVEDGKFGDQKYLDVWPEKYQQVHVVKNPTAGLAPWNIQQFKIISEHQLVHKPSGLSYTPVFYHFHKLRLFHNNLVSFTSSYYHLNKTVLDTFYYPYAKLLLQKDQFLLRRFKELYTTDYPKAELVKLGVLKTVKLYLYHLKRNLKNINGKAVMERLRNDYIFEVKI